MTHTLLVKARQVLINDRASGVEEFPIPSREESAAMWNEIFRKNAKERSETKTLQPVNRIELCRPKSTEIEDFEKGKVEGWYQGMNEGRSEGWTEAITLFANYLIRDNLPLRTIVNHTGLSLSQVQALANA